MLYFSLFESVHLQEVRYFSLFKAIHLHVLNTPMLQDASVVKNKPFLHVTGNVLQAAAYKISHDANDFIRLLDS